MNQIQSISLYRSKLAWILSVIFVVILLIQIIIGALEGTADNRIIAGLVSIFAISIGWIFEGVFKKRWYTKHILVGTISFLVAYVIIYPPVSKTSIFWIPVIPLISSILFGALRGVKISAVFLIFMFSCLISVLFGQPLTPYDSVILRQAIIAYMGVTAIIFSYERVNEAERKQLHDATDLLDRQAGEIIDKNKELENILFHEKNTQKATLNILEDIEEEKQLSERRAVDLQKFQMAVDYASNHIIITDSEGTVIYANPAVKTITGFSPSEIVGKKAGSKDLWGGQMTSEFYKELWETIKINKKTFVGEITNKRKDGSLYTAQATISPVVDASGRVQFFVGIERDISKEKEIEKLKSDFVSMASHELRTPMTAIKGFVSMILDQDYGPISDKLKQPLEDIYTSVERLIYLVNDMLNLSRIEAGRLRYKLEEISIKPVVDEVLKTLSPLAEEKGLRLFSDIKTGLKAQSDSDKLKQILNNLVGNSIKFTNKGHIKITAQDKKDEIVVFVEDTGVGISEKDQHKIFEKFQQIESQQVGKPAGTGLGLYINLQLVSKMGGRMWIEESVEGKGSIFAFSLPKANSEVAKKVKKLIIEEAENSDQKDMA